jgi:hypothetical protein
MLVNNIISINRSSGVEPLFDKIKIRKIKYMGEKYPNIVCLECLQEAWEDTKTFDGIIGEWSGAYSVYNGFCEICEQNKNECTEPRDAGYPNFDYVKQRIRSKKIKKIIDKI